MRINLPFANPTNLSQVLSYLNNLPTLDRKIRVIAAIAFNVVWFAFWGLLYWDYHRAKPMEGPGKISRCFGLRIDEGTFKGGKLDGEGTRTDHFRDLGTPFFLFSCREEGEFKDGELNGKGKITFSDGSVLKGIFKNGKLNGKGSYKRPDFHKFLFFGEKLPGFKQKGEFEKNDLNGEGKAVYPNGTIKEGTFGTIKEGILTLSDLTKGKITYADGTIKEGTFNENGLTKGKITYPDKTIKEGEFKDTGIIFNHEVLIEGKIIHPDGTVEAVS